MMDEDSANIGYLQLFNPIDHFLGRGTIIHVVTHECSQVVEDDIAVALFHYEISKPIPKFLVDERETIGKTLWLIAELAQAEEPIVVVEIVPLEVCLKFVQRGFCIDVGHLARNLGLIVKNGAHDTLLAECLTDGECKLGFPCIFGSKNQYVRARADEVVKHHGFQFPWGWRNLRGGQVMVSPGAHGLRTRPPTL